MASTFKTLLNSDIANTRTLLHEAIPITGTIVSGTYNDGNIKTFAHGMFQAVFDYPFLSSSPNHIFDVSAGYSSVCSYSASTNVQNAKKINIYNQHAQVLAGYDTTGSILRFDTDGDVAGGGTKMNNCIFINFSRLLTKDEIKKESFRLDLFSTASHITASAERPRSGKKVIGDYGAATDYRVNSPAGEYGLLYTSSVRTGGSGDEIVGHVYYQAGIAVITASYFSGAFADPEYASRPVAGLQNIKNAFTGSTISNIANAFRFQVDDINFNNTTELNSTIYFCRANTLDYNYSANPTYLNSSKIRVKDGLSTKAEPVSYITTVGLYSSDKELLAVAKLSEPLKKSPSNEVTLRVRLDY